MCPFDLKETICSQCNGTIAIIVYERTGYCSEWGRLWKLNRKAGNILDMALNLTVFRALSPLEPSCSSYKRVSMQSVAC